MKFNKKIRIPEFVKKASEKAKGSGAGLLILQEVWWPWMKLMFRETWWRSS